jgi:DNA/RNA endonuclease YhcR with UshA esterase domain
MLRNANATRFWGSATFASSELSSEVSKVGVGISEVTEVTCPASVTGSGYRVPMVDINDSNEPRDK